MPFFPPVPNALQNIQRFVVLMFENRSFDHLLGFEALNNPLIDGVAIPQSNLQTPGDPNSASVATGRATSFGMPFDPGHEFNDVAIQLHAPGAAGDAITMGGFVRSAEQTAGSFADAARVMECFQANQIPVLTTLSEQFATFNYWHSSLPGPTWPNRFFIHAATSGGLSDSPDTGQILAGFQFQKGTLYDLLGKAGRQWRIYHDGLPQSAGVDSLRLAYVDPCTKNFRSMDHFAADAAAGNLPEYTFIEPCYDTGNNYLSGNSMHPMNDIRKGEGLLKTVYESVRNSPALWPSTMLIVTFDEHGGFFDHVPPPAAVGTGDDSHYANPANHFDFTRLGVRVPGIVISAYTQSGTVVGQTPSDIYDHTSVLRTVENRFELPSLTRRDAAATPLDGALNLASPRTDAPAALPTPVTDAVGLAMGTAPTPPAVPPNAPLSDNQQSLVDLALRCNMDMANPAVHPALLAEHAAVTTQAAAARFLARHDAAIAARRLL